MQWLGTRNATPLISSMYPPSHFPTTTQVRIDGGLLHIRIVRIRYSRGKFIRCEKALCEALPQAETPESTESVSYGLHSVQPYIDGHTKATKRVQRAYVDRVLEALDRPRDTKRAVCMLDER